MGTKMKILLDAAERKNGRQADGGDDGIPVAAYLHERRLAHGIKTLTPHVSVLERNNDDCQRLIILLK